MAGEAQGGGGHGRHDTLGYYARLNVAPDATTEEIKAKYRQLVRFYHPDKVLQIKKQLGESAGQGAGGSSAGEGRGDDGDAPDLSEISAAGAEGAEGRLEECAREGFAKLQAAYETLSDPVLREVYDTYGSDGLQAGRSLVVVDDQSPSSLHRIREELQKTRLREEILEDIRKNGVPEQYGRVRYSGTYHAALAAGDAAAALSGKRATRGRPELRAEDGDDEDAEEEPSLSELLASFPGANLSLKGLSLNSNVTVQATPKDTVMVGGHIGQSFVQDRVHSQGSLSLMARRDVSPLSHLEFNAQMQMAGAPAAAMAGSAAADPMTLYASLKSFRQLTKDDSASFELSYTAQGGEAEVGLGLTSSRRLGQATLGELSLNLGAEPGSSLVFTRQTKRAGASLGVYAGKVMGFSGQLSRVLAVPRWLRPPKAEAKGEEEREGEEAEKEEEGPCTFVGKGAFKARTDALDLELGGSKKFRRSNLNVGWGAAVSHRGLYWRLRASHLGQRFLVPVWLSRSLSLPSVLATFLLPPLLVSLFMKTCYVPASRWFGALQGNAALEEEDEADLRASFRVAASDCVLMVGPALRKRKASHAAGDLVIVQAIYGDLDAFRRSATVGEGEDEGDFEAAGALHVSAGPARYNPSKLSNGRKWLDVTLPLQFMAKADRLVLHAGIAKHQLMGFCRPRPAAADHGDMAETAGNGGGHRLLVRYVHKGEAHQVVVSDLAAMSAPEGSHRVQGPAAAAIERMAGEIVEEAAEDIISALL